MSLSKPKVPDVHVTSTAGRMDAFLRPLWCMADEGVIEFGDGSLWATVKDPANVGMVDVQLSEGFSEFGGEAGKVGVPFPALSDVLETSDPGEPVRIRPGSEPTRQRWEFGDFRLDLGIIHPASIPDANVPDSIDFTAAVEVPAHRLRQAIERAGLIDDQIRFEVKPDAPALVVSAEGDIKDGKTRFTPDDGVAFPERGEAYGLYSYDYLKDIIAPTLTGVDAVTVSLGQPVPIEVAYRRECVAVRAMVAPRITEDPR